MTTVIVESKYKLAFESICELLKDGFLADKKDGNDFVSARVDGDAIIDGEYKYVLGKEREAAPESEKADSGRKGFGWFAGLRDYKKVSEKSKWEGLMENVSRTFHKLYSLVEYKEKRDDAAAERAYSACREAVNKIYGTFLPDHASGVELRECADSAMDDFYGVTLRTDISGSTGASVPILCKAYFKRVEGRLMPVTRTDAVDVENYLGECFNAAARSADDTIRSEAVGSKDDIIFGTIDAVDRLLKRRDGISFEDAIFFAGKEDEDEINRLVSQTAHNDATLRVMGAKILGISHVRWNSHTYDVYEYGEKMYRVKLGLNDMMTMTCLNCGTTIIDKNVICFSDKGTDTVITLYPKYENFGLTEREIKKLYDNKVFKKHNYRLTCPENFRDPHCTRYVCLTPDRVFTSEDEDGQTVYHCKTCPYAEIAYTDKLGYRHYTPTLAYAADTRDMVDASTLHKCDVCGRNIQGKGNRCPLCESIGLASEVPAARALYKKYRGMLPISGRLFVSAKNKRAYEDSEVILFCLNKKRYIVYKAALKESGLNDKPRRLDR